MSAACLRQTPASMARLATQQGFALTATTGRLRGSCEIVAVPDQFGAAWTAGQSVRPAASGSSEGAYAPGERRSKVVEARACMPRRDRVPVVAAVGTRSLVWRSVGEGEYEVEL